MSHFAVLVAASDDKDLEAKLQPFHEYECTGILDKHVVWVDDIHDSNFKDWQSNSCGYESFEKYMEDYCGYQEINPASGKYERLTNPNAKWDWWVVGGRYSDRLLMKRGSAGSIGLKSEIDWQAMTARKVDNFRAQAADFQKAFDAVSTEAAQAAINERLQTWFARSEIAQSLTGGDVSVAAKCSAAENALIREYGLIEFSEWACVLGDFDKELEKAKSQALSFAFVDPAGSWCERGSMGWWAMVSNKQEDYPKKFWAFINDLQEDQKLYMVDCHI